MRHGAQLCGISLENALMSDREENRYRRNNIFRTVSSPRSRLLLSCQLGIRVFARFRRK